MLKKLAIVWKRIELKQKLTIAGLFFGMVFSWGVAAWFINDKLAHPEPPYPPAPAYITEFLGILLVILFIICFSAEIYSQIRYKPVHWFFKLFFTGLQTVILTAGLSLLTVSDMVIVSIISMALFMTKEIQGVLFDTILLHHLDPRRRPPRL